MLLRSAVVRVVETPGGRVLTRLTSSAPQPSKGYQRMGRHSYPRACDEEKGLLHLLQ